MKIGKWGLLSMLFVIGPVSAERWEADIQSLTEAHTSDVVALRRWFHANPELGNREFNTAGRIAEELRALGFDEVREGIAHTGVIGILRGGQPGPVVALRADMDALPVKEKTGLPFASTVTTLW
jgi:metal-dependent amidase/aminoacylase/carboxypeptidase family protein